MNKFSNIELLLSDAHGIYIPKEFYESFDLEKWNLKPEDLTELSDPENENYWDTWDYVLNNACFILDGKEYTLYQDGDLWAIAHDHLTDEEKQNLGFDDF